MGYRSGHMGTLTVGKVRALMAPGRYGDGGTLRLVVSPRGTKSWVQRTTLDGRRHDLGLGGWPIVSLAMARDRAFANRRAVADGRDLLTERRKAKTPTFEAAVDKVIATHGRTGARRLRSGGRRSGRTPYPQIGLTSVDQITTADVMDVLVPISTFKHETARKV